ncbi:MAG: hypothetical protein O7E52_28650 [Candidatus Poribacteria bacterium]|nr:hypothetical protein [Candidatus Poribacteria bacterium]
MANVILLDPTDQGGVSGKFLAPRLDDLNGKRMGLLNISKNGSDIFLERVEELMRERFTFSDVIHTQKPTFARPAPTKMVTQLADQCDFVIEGLAD